MKRPLLGLVVLYAAGIWIGSLAAWPLHWVLVLAAGLLAVFVVARHTRWATPVLFAVVGLLGVAGQRQASLALAASDVRRLLADPVGPVRLRGVVVSKPTPGGGFQLRVEALASDNDPAGSGRGWQTARSKVYVFLRRGPTSPSRLGYVEYGDLIECTARLRPPRPPRNPGGFNWPRWLAGRGIALTATIGPGDGCRRLASGRANPATALALRLRERLAAALRAGLERDPQRSGVLLAMILGVRAEIPAHTYADFQQTGVFHIFSVSGLHVGLVAAVVVMTLQLLRLPKRWCGLVAIPLLVLYVFATGGRPGAVRALAMSVVVLLGWAWVRPLNLLNSLAAAALVLLIWNPAQLFDGGFQLSFAAVAA
ncbi:ComEC/Rec2 family competence protein, partial [bacterium]|nr:ComEC/Rec2 family competence protein [bacterium]